MTSAGLIGSPTTWVFVTEKSERGLLEGLRAGRTFLSSHPPKANGARIFLEADADGDGSYEAVMGDTAPQGSAVRARVEGGAGASLRVLTDGGEEAFAPVPITDDSFEHRFTLPEGNTWARAEAYEPGVEEGSTPPASRPPEPTGRSVPESSRPGL